MTTLLRRLGIRSRSATLFRTARAVGQTIYHRLSSKTDYRQVGVSLGQCIDPNDHGALRLLADLDAVRPAGEMPDTLKVWAIVAELLFGPAAYRTVVYATTRRWARSTNFESVYRALLQAYPSNNFPDAKTELPKLYRWALGRTQRQEAQTMSQQLASSSMLSRLLRT